MRQTIVSILERWILDRGKKELCFYQSNKMKHSSLICSSFVFYDSSSRIAERMSSAPVSHSKLTWVQECHRMHGVRQTGDRKTQGHSLAPSPLNLRDGRCDLGHHMRIPYPVSSSTAHDPPLSPSGNFPPEAADGFIKQQKNPYIKIVSGWVTGCCFPSSE